VFFYETPCTYIHVICNADIVSQLAESEAIFKYGVIGYLFVLTHTTDVLNYTTCHH